jgi:hypothetical protein
MTGIECSHSRYLSLLWPVRQSGAVVEHSDVILTLGLLSKQLVAHYKSRLFGQLELVERRPCTPILFISCTLFFEKNCFTEICVNGTLLMIQL